MSIIGAKYWDKNFYIQDNNATEGLLKKLVNKLKGWLETCGPTAAINCIAALIPDDSGIKCTCPGKYDLQPEDVLTNFMNDGRARYKNILKLVRAGVQNIPGNRIPQFYPVAVRWCFNINAEFRGAITWEKVIAEIKNGRTVQLCFKKPGHYIAVLGYDTDFDELIYNDPWAGHSRNKHGGHLERLSKIEFEDNIYWFWIVYFGKMV